SHHRSGAIHGPAHGGDRQCDCADADRADLVSAAFRTAGGGCVRPLPARGEGEFTSARRAGTARRPAPTFWRGSQPRFVLRRENPHSLPFALAAPPQARPGTTAS